MPPQDLSLIRRGKMLFITVEKSGWYKPQDLVAVCRLKLSPPAVGECSKNRGIVLDTL